MQGIINANHQVNKNAAVKQYRKILKILILHYKNNRIKILLKKIISARKSTLRKGGASLDTMMGGKGGRCRCLNQNTREKKT